MQISVVTTNRGKFLEIEDILGKFGIQAIQEPIEINEEGNTLEARCLSKAKDAFSKLQKSLIVDDTGLFFEAYENFPGPFPKKVFTELGFDGILEKLVGKSRQAHFKTLICYIDKDSHKFFDGTVNGKISDKVFDGGHESLPYDKVFIPEGYDVPFCLIPEQEQNKIKHRAKAVERFARWYSVNNK
ncbi:MAG: hypothetical protein HY512_00410 [Candidatus Aenigmarchaeota archaeon]|nr:hypothetical protein [Candidatus Aenigmarchaeota archaeon]